MHKNQNKGILAGVIAGVFWGAPFLAPLILGNFTAFEMTFGRFLFFGLISLFYLPGVIRLLKQFSLHELIQVFILSAAGFWLYTLALFIGIRLSNGVLAALIIGCLPLTITLSSKPKFNAGLVIGLGLIIVGIISLLVIPLLNKSNYSMEDVTILGLLVIISALAMWTWFGVYNSHFMSKHKHIKSIDYSSLVGVINLIFIIPIFMLFNGFDHLVHSPELIKFLIFSAVLGLGSSWFANICWAYSAKYCPPSIGGSLIVSETIFGLIYCFIFEGRLPYNNEYIAIICLISGVVLVINSQRLKYINRKSSTN